MIAATIPSQRAAYAKLLAIDATGGMTHLPRASFPDLVRAGDIVIANDAATLPASLSGVHSRTGAAIEVRLAGRHSLEPEAVREFTAVVFGGGNYHKRTEDRPSPPELRPGDVLQLGSLHATVAGLLDHPRLVHLCLEGSAEEIWRGLVRHGRPIQYAHVPVPLEIWDTWTPIAGPPVAYEPPSAGFILSWNTLDLMVRRLAHFGTVTHAAGVSSTGDPALDARLPFDEPYRIPESTVRLVQEARTRGGRVIAIGTTVVRALEHAVSIDSKLRAGQGLATQKIGRETKLRIVDAIVSGTHEPGTSHYELLRAFVTNDVLEKMNAELEEHGYRTHEFGDSIFLERMT
ncbi:MAG TPA: S-adenosylmethionine:tRNA ribosyltransferase-isomerase [Terriglobales bacterium]|nr:S-adenosylmethionine:tRNA ribosyltransferase-isomerase [Terriglobales bacterium]